MGEKTTENDASTSRSSIPNYRAQNLATLKAHLLFVDKSIEQATAAGEIVKVLTRELEQKNKQIALLQEELRVLKDAQQKTQEDAASLRSLTLEQSAKIAQTLDRMVQLQMDEQRWRIMSEQYKEAMDSQRLETMELRSKHETLLRNEASLQAKYEMLEAQLKESKSNSLIKNVDNYAQPNANEYWYQIGNVCCKSVPYPSSGGAIIYDDNSSESVTVFYKRISLRDCCYMVAGSWESVKQTTLRNSWNMVLGGSESGADGGRDDGKGDRGNRQDVKNYLDMRGLRSQLLFEGGWDMLLRGSGLPNDERLGSHRVRFEQACGGGRRRTAGSEMIRSPRRVRSAPPFLLKKRPRSCGAETRDSSETKFTGCHSIPTVTCVEKEAAWTGKNLPSLEIVDNSRFDKSSLSSVGREQSGSAAIEHVNIRQKEILVRPGDFRSSKSGVSGEEQPCSSELENAEKQTRSMATAILKIAPVEMALPPLVTPISQAERKERLPSEQARKESNSEPKRSVRVYRPSDEDKTSTTASLVQAEASSEKEKEKTNTALKLCSIPRKVEETKNCDIATSVQKSRAARSAIQLIPIESVGKRGKWRKDRALHDTQPPVRKLVNADDGTHPLGSNVHVSATKSLVTVPAIGAADLDAANVICDLDKKRPLSKDVEVIRSENIIEHTDASRGVEERVAVHCDHTLQETSQEGKNNDLTFDWVIKFAGSFQLDEQCRVSLPPLSMPVTRGFTMERYLVGLFDKNAFLTPALACKRLHSLGESLTPQTLTNSIITVLLSRGFRTANLCRMALVVKLEPVKVKGERCIVELLERLFDVRPLAWRCEVKKLLMRQLLLRLRHLRHSLTSAQMETLCRFYVLFAENIKSTAAVHRLIEAAAVLVVEEKAELAMCVLISWPKAFKEIACDVEQAFTRVVLALLVKSTKAVPLNVMERLIFEFCGENIQMSTLEYERLFANLSDCLLLRGMVELSTVTGDVRLAKTWARKLRMLETLFKLSSDLSVLSAVRDKFYMDVITWPSKSSQLTISGNRLRSVLVSLIALAELADVTTAFCQLELYQIVRKLEEILKGEGMYAENTILRTCCCQLLVRLLPWYPKWCYRILEEECSAAIAGAQWRRLFKIAKRVYIDGIMPK
ncbi:hypothetical protein M514_00333, partial [Trichuris suis]